MFPDASLCALRPGFPCAGHSAPSSIAEDSLPEKQESAPPKRGWALLHWVQLVALLALVISPAALFAAGRIAASSASGRERLVSGAYGSGAASFGRCVQHMLAPGALPSLTAGHPEYTYQSCPGSAPHLSEELACFVTAAASESQQGFSAAAKMASKALLSLHAHSVSMAGHVKGLLSPALQLCGGPAKMAMQSLHRAMERMCPACMAPCTSAGAAIQQLSVQHGLRLGSSEAMGSRLPDNEQIASWAPAQPSSGISQLLSASQTLLSLVPEPVTRRVTDAYARVGTWLHMCATWRPSQQPQLTALHSAVYLAHDSANIALHSLKRAAGCACSMCGYAGTCLCDAGSSISAQAAAAWEYTSSLLQYAGLAAMTDAERDAHLASKMPHDGPLDSAAREQIPGKDMGIAGWLGSLWEGRSSPSASTAHRLEELDVISDEAHPVQADSDGEADSSAAAQHAEGEVLENSSGLAHIQLDNGGVITWDGQPGQAGQPEPPTGKEAGKPEDGIVPDESQPDAIEAEHSVGLQHVESAEGGTVTWAGQTEQPASEAVEASLDPPLLNEGTHMPSNEEPAVGLSHTQTEGGGSVTWTGQTLQPESQHETSHLDAAAAKAAGTDSVPDRVRQPGGGVPDQDAEASCSVHCACQSEVQDYKPAEVSQSADVQHTEAAAEGLSGNAHGDDKLGNPRTGDMEQVPSEPAPDADAAEAGPDMAKADAVPDNISSGDSADVSREGIHITEEASSDDSTEGRVSSSAEDIAAALADAVHTLEEAHGAQQPDQDSQADEDEGASDVTHSHGPVILKSRLSRLAEVGRGSLTCSFMYRPSLRST